MRVEEFKMERENLVSVGDRVNITEGALPASYYYTVEPAVAMSGNYAYFERIKSREGVVQGIVEKPAGFYVQVAFDEEVPEKR
ncbi:MAG: hypothetical protein IJ291_07465 [Lachnospiraceae bacterium]|nr:hypothetical protein [Lachnospiraceae bacterium]